MRARRRRLPYVTTLHGTDITLVGADRSYLPITRFSIEQSDGVTVHLELPEESVPWRVFEIQTPIEVIPNFVNCDLYRARRRKVTAARVRITPGPTRRSWCICPTSGR